MSSYGFTGLLSMNPDFENKKYLPGVEENGRTIPKVSLFGCAEQTNRHYGFAWDDDLVIVSTDKQVVTYTRTTFQEILIRDEIGKPVWMDCRYAPHCDCGWFEYQNKSREAHEYTIEEYNVETKMKRRYKVSLEEEGEFDLRDYLSLSDYVDADMLGSYVGIKDGVFHKYVGHDADLIIPEGITKLGEDLFLEEMEFESITFPSTLMEINPSLFTYCRTKRINVAEDNPKYYTMDGCLIDRETGTLVWGYAATDVPRDIKIKIIGPYAFANRRDLETIMVPDNIRKIGSYAFLECTKMKSVVMSDAVELIEEGAFCYSSLDYVRLSNSLTELKGYTFANCIRLKTLEIPNTITIIDSCAFYNCKLDEVCVSQSLVETIEKALAAKLVRNGDKWLVERPAMSSQKVSKNFGEFEF